MSMMADKRVDVMWSTLFGAPELLALAPRHRAALLLKASRPPPWSTRALERLLSSAASVCPVHSARLPFVTVASAARHYVSELRQQTKVCESDCSAALAASGCVTSLQYPHQFPPADPSRRRTLSPRLQHCKRSPTRELQAALAAASLFTGLAS